MKIRSTVRAKARNKGSVCCIEMCGKKKSSCHFTAAAAAAANNQLNATWRSPNPASALYTWEKERSGIEILFQTCVSKPHNNYYVHLCVCTCNFGSWGSREQQAWCEPHLLGCGCLSLWWLTAGDGTSPAAILTGNRKLLHKHKSQNSDNINTNTLRITT